MNRFNSRDWGLSKARMTHTIRLTMKNSDSDETMKNTSKNRLFPKANIESLCKEAQGFLDFLDKEPPPPDRTNEIEREKLLSRLKMQLDDF